MFEDLIYQNLRQVGANSTEQSQLPTGLQIGLGVRTVATSRSFTQGSLQQTSNQLDVAIKGNGFFQVTHARRHHRLHPRRLVPGRCAGPAGHRRAAMPVATGITMPANAHERHHRRATARCRPRSPASTAPQPIGTMQLANFINPAGLEPSGENLYAETAASGTPQTGTPGTNGLGTVMQGFLETSNVNVVQELVSMIQTQRAYEMNSKAIQTSDQMLQKLAQL